MAEKKPWTSEDVLELSSAIKAFNKQFPTGAKVWYWIPGQDGVVGRSTKRTVLETEIKSGAVVASIDLARWNPADLLLCEVRGIESLVWCRDISEPDEFLRESLEIVV